VLRTLPLCTCCRHYPGAAVGDSRRSSPQSYQPSPHWQAGRPAHRLFPGLLGVHSRYGLHTRAATVIRGSHSKGFNRFVTSTVAPVASGWSCRRVGLSPTGKRRLFTAHATLRHSCRQNRSNKAAICLIPECRATFHGPERCKRESPASAAADAASRLRPGISMGTARRYCSYPTPCSNTRSRSSN
jgi:hypothetical protein